MKTLLISLTIALVSVFQTVGQINPVQNLNWSQWYEMPHNLFILEWDEPELPHNEITGYNIYRDNDLFMFISGETSIYNSYDIFGDIVSNCGGIDFLMYNDGQGFYVHVTAVYEPDGDESGYTETIFIPGALIGTEDFDKKNVNFYPNPSQGRINVEIKELGRILIYDASGRIIRDMEPQSEIDLSYISKGVYSIKLIYGEKSYISKIVIE